MVRHLVTVVVMVFALAVPVRADASWEDIWGVFDKMSGPGPFHARFPSFGTIPVVCRLDPGGTKYIWDGLEFAPCGKRTSRDIKWYVAIQTPVSWTTDRGLFSDVEEPRNRVRMQGLVQVSLLLRWPAFLRDTRVLEWGPAVGVSRFKADEAEDFTRGTLDLPKVRIIPLGFLDTRRNGSWFRVWQFDAGVQAFWPGTDQDDFCPPGRCAAPARRFETGADLHPYVLVMFDLSEVLWP